MSLPPLLYTQPQTKPNKILAIIFTSDQPKVIKVDEVDVEGGEEVSVMARHHADLLPCLQHLVNLVKTAGNHLQDGREGKQGGWKGILKRG